MNLPKQFSELEIYVEKWDLPDYNSRYKARLDSSLEELSNFYAHMLRYAEKIKSYLDDKAFDQYEEQDKCLARLMFAMGVVGPAVDVFKSVVVPDSGAAHFSMVLDIELA